MTFPSKLRGILSMVLAMGVFIANDSCMKLVLGDLPLFQTILMRGLAAIVICLPLLVVLGHARDIPRMFNPMLLARGLCEVVANFGFTFAIIYMAIADVTAIAQTCPLFVLMGAWLFWGEKLGPARLALIGLGVTGAMLVAQPGASAASPYAVLGFLTAIAAAARDLITRKVPTDIPALVVAFAVIVVLSLVSGICMVVFETPVAPSSTHILLVTMAAVFLICGHICIFLAFKIGPAQSVAPFMYSLTIWAVLASVIVFNDIPNTLAIAGMGLVALAGLLIIALDQRRLV